MRTLTDFLNELPGTRRARIEADAAALIAQERERREQRAENASAVRSVTQAADTSLEPDGDIDGNDAAGKQIEIFDVVALTSNLPDTDLVTGQVGTVIELLGSDTYEVEFIDQAGRSYATATVAGEQLLVLRYEPQQAASA